MKQVFEINFQKYHTKIPHKRKAILLTENPL